MTEYIVKRLLSLILVLFGMSLLTFTITHIIPADPARLVAGNFASAEIVEGIRERLGLHLPLSEQYLASLELALVSLFLLWTVRRGMSYRGSYFWIVPGEGHEMRSL